MTEEGREREVDQKGGECGKSEIGEANLPQKSSLISNQDIESEGGDTGSRWEGQREVMSRRGQTSQKLSLISVVLLCPKGLPSRGSDGYCWC